MSGLAEAFALSASAASLTYLEDLGEPMYVVARVLEHVMKVEMMAPLKRVHVLVVRGALEEGSSEVRTPTGLVFRAEADGEDELVISMEGCPYEALGLKDMMLSLNPGACMCPALIGLTASCEGALRPLDSSVSDCVGRFEVVGEPPEPPEVEVELDEDPNALAAAMVSVFSLAVTRYFIDTEGVLARPHVKEMTDRAFEVAPDEALDTAREVWSTVLSGEPMEVEGGTVLKPEPFDEGVRVRIENPQGYSLLGPLYDILVPEGYEGPLLTPCVVACEYALEASGVDRLKYGVRSVRPGETCVVEVRLPSG
ncbi:MAG: hypothetical protein GXO28_02060 [Methanopyri archaeon]|nr:hypothetical protein [Methanopyri archaeon]